MNGMEERVPAEDLTGSVVREVLRTGPLKEIILLHMKGIDPDRAAGLVDTLLWEDPAVSLSLMASAPGMVNWLVEFLLELGRQLEGLPGPLLGEILAKIGGEVDRGRLEELRAVYVRLARSLLLDEEANGGLDAESLGRLVNRLIVLGNARRRSRRAVPGYRLRAFLSQLDGREVLAALGAAMGGAFRALGQLLAWGVGALSRGGTR